MKYIVKSTCTCMILYSTFFTLLNWLHVGKLSFALGTEKLTLLLYVLTL